MMRFYQEEKTSNNWRLDRKEGQKEEQTGHGMQMKTTGQTSGVQLVLMFEGSEDSGAREDRGG